MSYEEKNLIEKRSSFIGAPEQLHVGRGVMNRFEPARKPSMARRSSGAVRTARGEMTAMETAEDVGNLEDRLASLRVLHDRQRSLQHQLARELEAMNGGSRTARYNRLLGELSMLGRAITSTQLEVDTARLREERLDMASLLPHGAVRAIQQSDTRFYSQLKQGLDRQAQGYNTALTIDYDMPMVAKDNVGRTKVYPFAAKAPDGETTADLEESYLAMRRAVDGDLLAANTSADFVLPTPVVDLIQYVVSYSRLYQEFNVEQTPGVNLLEVNRLTGIEPAAIIGNATNSGQRAAIPETVVETDSVQLRALKVAGLTTLSSDTLESLPEFMLREQIASYLGQSIALRFAESAVNGSGSSGEAAQPGPPEVPEVKPDAYGVIPFLKANTDRLSVGKAGVAADFSLFDRAEAARMFGLIGGAYQRVPGRAKFACNAKSFWQLWSHLQDRKPLFADGREYDGPSLGGWPTVIDDAIPDLDTVGNIGLLAASWQDAYTLRLAGKLRLQVSFQHAFRKDQLTIRAIQHFDVQPRDINALAGYQVQ